MPIQVSSGSSREQWVKVTLPATIVAILYLLLYHTSANRQLRTLREELSDKQKQAESDGGSVASLSASVTSTEKTIDYLEQETAQIEEEQLTLLASYQSSTAISRIAMVDRLCRKLEIGVIEQQETSSSRLPETQTSAMNVLEKLTKPQPIVCQQLDLDCGYHAILEFLKAIPQEVSGALPIGIELIATEVPQTPSNQVASEASPDESEQQRRKWRVFLAM